MSGLRFRPSPRKARPSQRRRCDHECIDADGLGNRGRVRVDKGPQPRLIDSPVTGIRLPVFVALAACTTSRPVNNMRTQQYD